MKRVHITVFGRVQGVFFRYNTKKVADKLGVKGWVKNNSDGTVEAVFEGEKNSVDKIIDWCKKGPMGARVERVDIEEEKNQKEFKKFSIIY
ncbi:MAG: acylphosphatase [Candidatus Aenigmatarchaeota archaeon]